MTGHAGSSVSTVSGMKAATTCWAKRTARRSRSSATGRFPAGIVFEAFNNIGGLNQNVLVILNDNKMSICPRTGGFAKLRSTSAA